MKTTKLFGMCIVFLLAAAAVNAITLEQLLNSYDSSYSNGMFGVEYSSYRYITNLATVGKEAGRSYVNFTVSGDGADSPYKVVMVLDTIKDGQIRTNNFVSEAESSSPGIVEFEIDGNYFLCDQYANPTDTLLTFSMNVKVYQDNMLQYQKQFNENVICKSVPVTMDYFDSTDITAIDDGSDSRYEYAEMSLDMTFREIRTYRVGAYIWDSNETRAYAETNVTTTSVGQDKMITIRFYADALKDLELDNEMIQLHSVEIDGNLMDNYYWINEIYNYNWPNSNLYTTSDFDFSEIYINNYAFNETQLSNGKLTELGIRLTAQDYSGTYDVEISLENEYGEVIGIESTTTDFLSNKTTAWFNGTEIYESKINGPYRIGYIKITKSGQEVFYKTIKGLSSELSYMDFTAPEMPDIEIKDGDITNVGNDIVVTLFNNNLADAAGVTVSLFDNSANKIAEAIIDSIGAESSENYTFKNVASGSAFFAVADFSNSIEETNESNNIGTLILNAAPVLDAIGNKTTGEMQELIIDIGAEDADNDDLTFTAGPLPGDSEFVDNGDDTATFTWTPGYGDAGNYTVKFNVTDGYYIVSETINIEVSDSNRVPVITSTPAATATKGVEYSYTLTATDADNDSLACSVDDIRFSESTECTFTWTPSDTEFGKITPTFSVTDGKSTVNQGPITISIYSNSIPLKIGTLDYDTETFIDSTITVNSESKVVGPVLADFEKDSNTVLAITNEAAGHVPDTDYIYLDSRITSCVEGQDCVLTGAYTTNCVWQAASSVIVPLTNSWYCSVEGAGLEKDWFRYVQSPEHYARKFNYLVKG